MELIIAPPELIPQLKKLSTVNLIIWIIGKSAEIDKVITIEEITLECWMINPEKHSMRGYPEFPDSFVVMKRIFDMKGRKGLLVGTVQGGFTLTEISKIRYADIDALISSGKIKEPKLKSKADRTISSIDEAPYKRLKKTPAYLKFIQNRKDEIVEMDFLYFYGLNWHSKSTFVQNRIKNIDLVVVKFAGKDTALKNVHELLNFKYSYVKDKLLKR